MQKQRIHVIVKGKVQGVYFRAATQEQAQNLGVTGWVRNLANGDVEFEAQGSQEQLDGLLLWAQRGPSHAAVEQVVCNPCSACTDELEFVIQR